MMFFINILQAALVSTVALAEPELAAPEPDDEATEPGDEAIERSPAPYCGQYGVACSMSGNTSTGR
ncbi:hypothetical protein [Nannocystis pusilla]|uniref:hypothetical protein n=1 Tax=Nannocystis pusilla TaxID=889268 RepID=UPI003DA3BCB7